MAYHVVLNAISKTLPRQVRELNSFIAEFLNDEEAKETIIIATEIEEITETVTENVRFILVDKYDTDKISEGLSEIVNKEDLYLFASDFAGMELAVATNALLEGSSIVNCTAYNSDSTGVYADKMVYSNNLVGTFKLMKSPYFVSVAKGFKPLETEFKGYNELPEIDLRVADYCDKSNTIFTPSKPSVNIEQSEFLVVAGRGVGSKINLEMLETEVTEIGAVLGVSRPVAMNAWTDMDKMVGVSGNMCKPNVCISVGASGAGAFYAGIAKSKLIVSINTDENAPILKGSDYVVIGDYKPIISELVECFRN